MANPLAWLPFHGDKRSRRAALLGGALTASLCMHFGLPFIHWQRIEAVSETPVQVTLLPPPPVPVPEADEPVEAPDEDDVDAPKKEDAPVQKPQKEADKETPPKVEEPPAKVSVPPPIPTVDRQAAWKARLADLQRRRAERLAERMRQRAEREAARQRLGLGGKKGGAPDTGAWKTGKPDSTYLCTANDKGIELHVMRARPLREWITIVPTVLAGFDTRPGLGGYLDHVQQIVQRDHTHGAPRRLGFVELGLPSDVLQFPLEEPRGVRIAVGRLDAHCMVGFKYAARLFPFTIQRAPVRIIDGSNHTVNALVDVTFFKDVSLEIHSVDGTELPFTRGRLKNGSGIQRNIEDHYEAARLAKSIADLFGIKLVPHHNRAARAPARHPRATKTKNLAEGRPAKRAQD